MDDPIPHTIPLSILIRTLNEADRIGATIRSAAPLGAEIVVIDAGSSDATVQIARSLGARVFFNSWLGFGPQRFFGEEQCTHDFIFSLDADEVLTSEIVEEIRSIFARPQVPRLMIVRKAIVFPNRVKPAPLGFCHEQILIYDRKIARTGPNPNWDKLEISAADKAHVIRAPLWHFTFRNWAHALSKANYVAELAAETQPLRSRSYLISRLLLEFPLTFIKFYVFRRYCLGGRSGLIMALVSAYGRFLRIAMMLDRAERERSEKQRLSADTHPKKL